MNRPLRSESAANLHLVESANTTAERQVSDRAYWTIFNAGWKARGSLNFKLAIAMMACGLVEGAFLTFFLLGWFQ